MISGGELRHQGSYSEPMILAIWFYWLNLEYVSPIILDYFLLWCQIDMLSIVDPK